MMKPLRIAIAGLGTVGAGVVQVLQRNADLITVRAGREIQVAAVNARSRDKDRGVDLSSYEWVEDAAALAGRSDIDVVVELIGGSDGAGAELVRASLKNGKHVVTANKALLAVYGGALAVLAEEKGVQLRYEAAVAGCVPVIKALRESFAANRITGIYGILNGTCNYILTQMRLTGRDFDEVLEEAQAKGYAEADPTFDVEGIDTAHKLAILSAIAYGVKPDLKSIGLAGIRGVSAQDMIYAGEFGFKIKLLGISQVFGERQIVQSVEPCLVPVDTPLGLAMIEDVFNGVFIEGDNIDTPLLSGRGAGASPTSSSVVADIIDLARGLEVPTFGVPVAALKSLEKMDPGLCQNRFYVRLMIIDKVGVMADVAAIFRDHNVSMENVIQKGHAPGQHIPLVLTTHEARRADVVAACGKIAALESIVADPVFMRIEGGV